MPAFIDIHSHILHAIDDGPQNLAGAVDLARAYVDAGFDTVVATPHSFEGKPEPAHILNRHSELEQELIHRDIALKVLPGAEQHLEPNLLERLQNNEALTLNNTRYLLLELPFFQPLPSYTLPLIDNLVTAGYVPVITHPERTLDLQQKPQLLHLLHAAGAFFQATWGALSGKLGPAPRRMVSYMLEGNLAHFFATDTHHYDSSLLELKEPRAILTEKKGEGFVNDLLISRPRCLLENQTLELPLPGQHTVTTGSPIDTPKAPLISRLRRRIGR